MIVSHKRLDISLNLLRMNQLILLKPNTPVYDYEKDPFQQVLAPFATCSKISINEAPYRLD